MVMADSLSAQSVGREFVKQYYTMMNQAPNFLHRFYSNNSSFVHSSIDQPGEDQPVIVGQQEIHKKIMSLNFRDCHAKIRQVDSQASVSDGVIIQVIGELSNDGGPLQPFVQTFVLVAQSPRKYYVHNDIFRYIGGVTLDKCGSSADITHATDSGDSALIEGPCNGNIEQGEELLPNMTTTFYRQPSPAVQQPLSNGVSHVESEPEVVAPAEQVHATVEPAVISAAEQVAINPPESNESDLAPTTASAEPEKLVESQHEVQETKTEQPEETSAEPEVVAEAEVEQPVETEPKVVKPVTWAAMASKTPASVPPQSRAAPPPAVRVVKTQPTAVRSPSDTKSESNQSSHSALPQRAPRQNVSQEPAEHEANRAPADNDDSRRPQIPQQNYPDCQQIFVGNLPQYLSDKDLREFFSQFGEVIEMKINRKSGNMNNLPYFGFVVFDSAETVQKVLSNRPLFLTVSSGKHRINVEEKKPRAELQAARPRSASKGSARPSGAFSRGSDTYSRGGGRSGGSNASGENVRNSGADEGQNGVVQ